MLLFHLPLIAQNLVPNGDFEVYKKCPKQQGKIKTAVGWYSTNPNKADYYNQCGKSDQFGFNNYMGSQNAKSGTGYCGISINGNNSKEFEYIQIKLSESLRFNKRYRVTFWISYADKSQKSTDLIGCIVTEKAVRRTAPYLYKPQVYLNKGNTISNNAEWIQVTGTFISTGSEQYLTIGNFYGSEGGNISYYYIDDVSLIQEDINDTNLIANGDFEDYFYCPTTRNSNTSSIPYWNKLPTEKLNEDHSLEIKKRKEGNEVNIYLEENNTGVAGLSSETYYLGSADYFNDCNRFDEFYTKSKLPKAYSGHGFGGINLTGKGGKFRACEYLQGITIKPLEKGLYCFQMYIRMDKASKTATSSIGVYFSQLPIYKSPENSGKVFDVIPQIATKGIVISNKTSWICITDTFEALGGEQYLTIGDYDSNYPTVMKNVSGKEKISYYYFDKVSLFPLKNDTKCQCAEKVVIEKDSIFVGETYTLENVHFKSGKSELQNNEIGELDSLAIILIKQPNSKITIIGYTDNIGQESDNLTLSNDRAKAVADYLIGKGVEAKRITYKGMGSGNPVANNSTEEGRQLNRRVEFTIE